MQAIGLYVNSFCFIKKHRKFDPENMLNFYDDIEFIVEDENGHDQRTKLSPSNLILNFIQDYSEKNYNINKEEDKVYRISNFSSEKGEKYELYKFNVSSGSYGSKASVIDVETNNETYQIDPNEAVIRDFRIYFVFPNQISKKSNENVYKGLVLFQTIGNFGVKQLTQEFASNYFEKYNLNLHINNVSTTDFVQSIFDRYKISKIEFIDNLKNDKSINSRVISGAGSSSLVITRPIFRENYLAKFIKHLVGLSDKGTILEFENKNYDNVKIVYSNNGNQRTVNFRHLEGFSTIERVPDENVYKEDEISLKLLDTYVVSEIIDYYLEQLVYY